jgi:hypothetical protein
MIINHAKNTIPAVIVRGNYVCIPKMKKQFTPTRYMMLTVLYMMQKGRSALVILSIM